MERVICKGCESKTHDGQKLTYKKLQELDAHQIVETCPRSLVRTWVVAGGHTLTNNEACFFMVLNSVDKKITPKNPLVWYNEENDRLEFYQPSLKRISVCKYSGKQMLEDFK